MVINSCIPVAVRCHEQCECRLWLSFEERWLSLKMREDYDDPNWLSQNESFRAFCRVTKWEYKGEARFEGGFFYNVAKLQFSKRSKRCSVEARAWTEHTNVTAASRSFPDESRRHTSGINDALTLCSEMSSLNMLKFALTAFMWSYICEVNEGGSRCPSRKPLQRMGWTAQNSHNPQRMTSRCQQ